ncbi:MAG: sodium-translocating pyrophosphatase [Planctomycetaceae bacterium]|nr:sodium-translocating pyrophosphatase [Planctomycetaceae bacterium]
MKHTAYGRRGWSGIAVLLTLSHGLTGVSTAVAAEQAAPPATGFSDIVAIWGFVLLGAIIALFAARNFFRWMVSQDEGDPAMIEIADAVRAGAKAYLNQQYKVVIKFFIAAGILLAILAFVFGTQSKFVPLAFWTSGFYSGLAGWFGMRTATLASSRTAWAAKNSLNQGLQVAFRSGAVMGLVVVGLGLLDLSIWFGILYGLVGLSLQDVTITMLCGGMGASSQALFARVGGGIFTKAADVGADLVGKVEKNIPEDDPRNPATIADNVGDNVGDVAGMGADLYESYCGSILATAALGVAAFQGSPTMQLYALLLPYCLASIGAVLSIFGVYQVRTEEGATQHNLLHALDRGVNVATAGSVVAAFILVYLLLVMPASQPGMLANSQMTSAMLYGVALSIVIGCAAGWLIGKWTGYVTSQEYPPTQRIAKQALTGPATVIIAGIAEGFASVWAPIAIIAGAILLAFSLTTGFQISNADLFALGLYGIGMSAVGMLSTLAITLATDAYGPIADNAGGNAEMSHQPSFVRERTDALDSLGNTTAATGKGFAIGSAALTALALLAAYMEEVRVGLGRWAAKEPAIAESTDLGNVTMRKLSPNLLAMREEGATTNQAVLLFADRRFPELTSDIQKAPVGATLEGVDLEGLRRSGQAILHSRATIPDLSRFYDLSLVNPRVLVGLFLGTLLVYLFTAMTMKAVGRAAGEMVDEVRRQFREFPGIFTGEQKPDYQECVSISTKAAQREMLAPTLLALLVPIAVGMVLGVAGVVGVLAGGLVAGFAVAVMMANSGGAWDNAKKFVESGAHGGKGSDAHKATVVGDTVGDPFKDTSGPSINILIKLMSIVSVVAAGLIVQYAVVWG